MNIWFGRHLVSVLLWRCLEAGEGGNLEVEGVVESPTDKPGGDLIDPNLSFLSGASVLLAATAW